MAWQKHYFNRCMCFELSLSYLSEGNTCIHVLLVCTKMRKWIWMPFLKWTYFYRKSRKIWFKFHIAVDTQFFFNDKTNNWITKWWNKILYMHTFAWHAYVQCMLKSVFWLLKLSNLTEFEMYPVCHIALFNDCWCISYNVSIYLVQYIYSALWYDMCVFGKGMGMG